ncbi:MAG TPA: acetyl-CoA acetyltransferase [Dehalococcoidia bacterium]|nr:acetyl-CoA acetyltransferase [Dehalococcoidia bacterium]
MSEPSIRDRAAIAGIGETHYYKRGGAPVSEFALACEAVLRAADDAGLAVEQIDGFASYSNDRNEPVRLAAALGLPELRWTGMVWGGGGGGVGAAVANAAAAVAAGYAQHIVVFRSLAQGQFRRFGQGTRASVTAGMMAYSAPYGLLSAAQVIALRTRRFMEEHGATVNALAGIALASYHHAQFNPRAVMYGRPLSREDYDNSRWIVEPFHLFDCCQENDGAAALIVTTPERARDLKHKPAYVMAAAQGSMFRHDLFTHAGPDYATANFKTLAPRLFAEAGIEPKDVDVAQVYENFTGGELLAMAEHGFFAPEEADAFCTVENLTWPHGKLPINTSGGNLAECYMHGLELVNEAVRQVRGESTCQVENCRVSLVIGGPVAAPVSSLLLHP